MFYIWYRTIKKKNRSKGGVSLKVFEQYRPSGKARKGRGENLSRVERKAFRRTENLDDSNNTLYT